MTDLNSAEQQIREHAYRLWQEAGSPDGGHEEFWHKAAQELENGGNSSHADSPQAHSSQADASKTEKASENTGEDLVEKAGGHYPPTSDSQNFA
jgi:hypothetical protein